MIDWQTPSQSLVTFEFRLFFTLKILKSVFDLRVHLNSDCETSLRWLYVTA